MRKVALPHKTFGSTRGLTTDNRTRPLPRSYEGVDFRNRSSWFCNDRASPIM